MVRVRVRVRFGVRGSVWVWVRVQKRIWFGFRVWDTSRYSYGVM